MTSALSAASFSHPFLLPARCCPQPDSDGLIEAIEHQHHPWMFGLQRHPEMSAQDPAHQRLFQAFVDAAIRMKR
ncbi:hypothetical protein [Phormidesmis priestleyi]|uniref:hypothetical protein n=1 Tax=Phormidesmis priestleyi TaxID=268141 RepID=UPI00083B19BA|nr:hypothetical protein [Phormidesmis priestleyi]